MGRGLALRGEDLFNKRLAVTTVLASMVLLAACNGGGEDATPSPTAPVEFQGHVLDPPFAKPEFVLTDTGGDAFDFADETEGYITALYFGYTHCPDICPAHMADLASVLEQNPDLAEHVRVVFVTMDPARDTPERLRTWLELFNPDFVGLSGSTEEVQAAADEALGELSFPIETEAFGEGDYSVSHAALVLVYGHDGMARVSWPFATQLDEYENDLRILVQEGAANHES
jgi:protein SCO1/2